MNNIGRIKISFFLFIACICHRIFSRPSPIHIVSILDESSRLSALIKTHSIIKSAFHVKQLVFHFLVFSSENFTVDTWKSDFQKCYGDIQLNVAEWKRPPLLNLLKRDKFEIDIIFARFYLPQLFPDAPRFIYLDNDIVVNCDLNELMFNPLMVKEYVPPSIKPTAKIAIMQNPRHIKSPFRTTSQRIALASDDRTAIVGFVAEQHSAYRSYIEAHFNGSHPLVKKTKELLPNDLFLNAGVFLVDANRWRNENITGLAEALIIQNAEEHLYSTSVGDQGIFYLLFQDKMAYLPAQYNMRRLPKKTFYMLEENILGIVHFAGMTHGDAIYLCRDPLQYPILYKAVLPLYLSIVYSFNQSCPSIPFHDMELCNTAIQTLNNHIVKNRIIVQYNGGKGHFPWPPALYEVGN